MSRYNNTLGNTSINYSNTNVNVLDGRWILAQRDNLSVSIIGTTIETSLDSSVTFSYSLVFADADKVNDAHILKNGNILFFTTENKIYLADHKLSYIAEKFVFQSDGVTPYTIHTPQNSNRPGRYFYTHRHPSAYIGTDVFCWINYCNVNNGASPINIFYTADFGKTIKVAYEFGQNPRWTDNGSASGGKNGTLLGDASNSVDTRHGHCIEWCEELNKWFCMTGDADVSTVDQISYNEIHWLEGEYNDMSDTWTWSVIDFGYNIQQQSQLKITECFFYDGYIYYNTDATNLNTPDDTNGIYRAPLDSITDLDTHQKLIDWTDTYFCSNMKIDRNTNSVVFVLADQTDTSNQNRIYSIAKNFASGEVQYYDLVGVDSVCLDSINEAGFFRADAEKFIAGRTRTVFIKAGDDLFNNI